MTTDINLDASLGSMPRPQNWISHLYPSENNTAVKDSKEGDQNSKQDVGRKDDTGKVRMELIPPEIKVALGTILGFGATKYDDRNWEKGMDWSRCYGALERHMTAWWSGENSDAETGESHLWHALCCISFLVAYERRGVGKDDRPYINKKIAAE